MLNDSNAKVTPDGATQMPGIIAVKRKREHKVQGKKCAFHFFTLTSCDV